MGDVSKRVKAATTAFALALTLVFCTTASAGTALVGDSFPITYLDLPANAVPAGNSGILGPGYTNSPASTCGSQ